MKRRVVVPVLALALAIAAYIAITRRSPGYGSGTDGRAQEAGEAPIVRTSRQANDAHSAGCDHAFLGVRPGRIWTYEIRPLVGSPERLRIQYLAPAPRDGVDAPPLLRYLATHESLSHGRRRGHFSALCRDGAAESPIDQLAAARSRGDEVELPRFLLPDQFEQGQRFCRTQPMARGSGSWRRCTSVVDIGVPIVTQAGHFDAVELLREDEMRLPSRSVTGRSHVWVAEGVGVVRVQIEGGAGITELVDFVSGTDG